MLAKLRQFNTTAYLLKLIIIHITLKNKMNWPLLLHILHGMEVD